MIREYKESDYTILNIIGRDISMDYKVSFSPVSKCYVYELDNEVVGFIIIDLFEDRSEIVDVAVLLLHRNKGIGDKLVKKAIEVSKDNGCDNITLEVKVDNTFAINLYKKNEFKTVSIRKRYYNNGSTDAYLMQRKL